MDIQLDLKNTQNNLEHTETEKFIQELQEYLNSNLKILNKVSIDTNLYNEMFNSLEFAPKHPDKLEDIIKECMIEHSKFDDFLYVNYDKTKKDYYLDYYIDGDVHRNKITKQEIESEGYKLGEFYHFTDNDNIELAEPTKNGLKIEVSVKLDKLEPGNKIGEIKWN